MEAGGGPRDEGNATTDVRSSFVFRMREGWKAGAPSRPATYPGRRARNPNGTFGAQDQVRSVAVRRDPELSCGRKPPLQRVEKSYSAS
jgi:hypothetical protein